MSKTPLLLSGKVAIITGAGSGIGAATAKLFTELGATIAILDITKAKLENTIAECKKVSVGQPQPLMIVGNVKDNDVRKQFIDDTVKKFGKLDILVNNAATASTGTLLHGSIAEYDETFDVNLRSAIVLTQLAAPHLMKTKGSIVNLCSLVAKTVAHGSIYYSMSKIALEHFTRHAAQEFGPYQVRVNSVSPGVTRTNFPVNLGIKEDQLTQFFDNLSNMQVVGRAGEPSEIAKTIAFLASDDASFITGADLLVDGGCLVSPMARPSARKN